MSKILLPLTFFQVEILAQAVLENKILSADKQKLKDWEEIYSVLTACLFESELCGPEAKDKYNVKKIEKRLKNLTNAFKPEQPLYKSILMPKSYTGYVLSLAEDGYRLAEYFKGDLLTLTSDFVIEDGSKFYKIEDLTIYLDGTFACRIWKKLGTTKEYDWVNIKGIYSRN